MVNVHKSKRIAKFDAILKVGVYRWKVVYWTEIEARAEEIVIREF